MAMAQSKNTSNKEYESPEDGRYDAVLYRFIDIGTQETTYKGETKHKRRVMLSFELPNTKMSDGRPFTVHTFETYTSFELGNLAKHIKSIMDKDYTQEELDDFDVQQLIGQSCSVRIATNDKGYQNITDISYSEKKYTPENETVCFNMVDGYSQTEFSKISDRMQEKIRKSPEFQAILASGGKTANPDDSSKNHPKADEIPAPKSEADYGKNPLDDEIPF
jgi:hypothetical protein